MAEAVAARRSAIGPVLLAALIALVLGARVFVSFLPVRVVALPQPIAVTDSTLTVTLRNSRLDTLQPPFAVVVRIGNRSTRAERVSIALDGSPVCDVAVPAGRSTRYDCAATGPWTPGAAHTVTLAGPSGPWSVDYLEVATHSGRSTGFLSAVVLPAGSANYRRAPVWWAVGLGVLLVAGGSGGGRRSPAAGRPARAACQASSPHSSWAR